MKLAQNLSAVLKQKRITYSHLESLSGVPRSTLHGWATGRGVRNLDEIVKVAQALDVDLLDLLFGKNGESASFRRSHCLRIRVFKFSDFLLWTKT